MSTWVSLCFWGGGGIIGTTSVNQLHNVGILGGGKTPLEQLGYQIMSARAHRPNPPYLSIILEPPFLFITPPASNKSPPFFFGSVFGETDTYLPTNKNL